MATENAIEIGDSRTELQILSPTTVLEVYRQEPVELNFAAETTLEIEGDQKVSIPNAEIEIIEIGVPGPQGPKGLSADELVPLATRLDEVTDALSYLGEADAGTLETSAGWRIRRITFGDDGDVTTEFADGNDNFDNVWQDRIGLTYT